MGRAGASVMTPPMAKTIVNSGLVAAMQAPDRRPSPALSERRRLPRLPCRRGVALVVAQYLCPGLILMPRCRYSAGAGAQRDARLAEATGFLAAEAGMSLAEMAVRYVLALEGVMCGVVGVETVAQMKDNIAIFNKGPLDDSLMKAVIPAVPDLPTPVSCRTSGRTTSGPRSSNHNAGGSGCVAASPTGRGAMTAHNDVSPGLWITGRAAHVRCARCHSTP